jgi:hypothetical protein
MSVPSADRTPNSAVVGLPVKPLITAYENVHPAEFEVGSTNIKSAMLVR